MQKSGAYCFPCCMLSNMENFVSAVCVSWEPLSVVARCSLETFLAFLFSIMSTCLFIDSKICACYDCGRRRGCSRHYLFFVYLTEENAKCFSLLRSAHFLSFRRTSVSDGHRQNWPPNSWRVLQSVLELFKKSVEFRWLVVVHSTLVGVFFNI